MRAAGSEGQIGFLTLKWVFSARYDMPLFFHRFPHQLRRLCLRCESPTAGKTVCLMSQLVGLNSEWQRMGTLLQSSINPCLTCSNGPRLTSHYRLFKDTSCVYCAIFLHECKVISCEDFWVFKMRRRDASQSPLECVCACVRNGQTHTAGNTLWCQTYIRAAL